jgi:tetratricopeptide (TPR) repeat protein
MHFDADLAVARIRARDVHQDLTGVQGIVVIRLAEKMQAALAGTEQVEEACLHITDRGGIGELGERGPTPLSFSQDGAWFIAATDQRRALLWDLRSIRKQLRTMGLDWDQPPFPSEHEIPVMGKRQTSPIRTIRVIGEVLEQSARREAEMVDVNRQLRNCLDDAEALFHRGWLYSLSSRWPEVVVDLERGLKLRPDDTDALFLLFEACIQASNLPAARAALDRLLAISPDDTEVRRTRGQVALLLGHDSDAVENFTRVLNNDPTSAYSRCRRTRALLRLGRFHEAATDLDELIVKYPRDSDHYELRAQAHEGLGRHDLAQADRKRFHEMLPREPRDINNLAWEMATGPYRERDPTLSLALARKAVAMAPDQSKFLNTLGVAEYRAGHHAQAIITLERSLAIGKGQADAFDLFFLAMARHQLGQIAQANADFKRALKWRQEYQKRTHPRWDKELDSFQAEARAMLEGQTADLPAEVFSSARADRP